MRGSRGWWWPSTLVGPVLQTLSLKKVHQDFGVKSPEVGSQSSDSVKHELVTSLLGATPALGPAALRSLQGDGERCLLVAGAHLS